MNPMVMKNPFFDKVNYRQTTLPKERKPSKNGALPPPHAFSGILSHKQKRPAP